MKRYGELIARTGGMYIPGVDMGTTMADMQTIRDAGARAFCDDIDPGPYTAQGAYAAMRAGVRHALGSGMSGVRVLVQAHAVAGLLRERGITFVPDFIANAGGVIQVHAGQIGWDEAELDARLERIGDRVADVLASADEQGQTPVEAALIRARDHIAARGAETTDFSGGAR